MEENASSTFGRSRQCWSAIQLPPLWNAGDGSNVGGAQLTVVIPVPIPHARLRYSGKFTNVGDETKFIGEIKASAGLRPITRAEWIELIAKRSDLVLGKDREGINPFTKLPTVYRAPDDWAGVVVGGKRVGSIHWALDDSPALIVWARRVPDARPTVSVIALQIAEALGVDFVPGSERDWA